MLVRLPISLATALLLTAALYLGMQALINMDKPAVLREALVFETQRPKPGFLFSIPDFPRIIACCPGCGFGYFLEKPKWSPIAVETSAPLPSSDHLATFRSIEFGPGKPNWDANPMYRQQPKFEGITQPEFITLAFDVTSDGSVAANTITVIESSSSRVERPAIRAVKQWKYFPKLVDGRSVWQRDVRVRFTVEPAS